MNELTSLQRLVIDEARRRLKGAPGYNGVCLVSVPTDVEIKRDGFLAAVESIVLETALFDCNN